MAEQELRLGSGDAAEETAIGGGGGGGGRRGKMMDEIVAGKDQKKAAREYRGNVCDRGQIFKIEKNQRKNVDTDRKRRWQTGSEMSESSERPASASGGDDHSLSVGLGSAFGLLYWSGWWREWSGPLATRIGPFGRIMAAIAASFYVIQESASGRIWLKRKNGKIEVRNGRERREHL